jgi:hypothetical protein
MSDPDSISRTEPEMTLEGRTEPRVSLPVLIYLSDSSGSEDPELVVTENVSTRGVRVICKRRCEPGEEREIVTLGSDLRLSAEIVYCQTISSDSFWVGLKIRKDRPTWWKSS